MGFMKNRIDIMKILLILFITKPFAQINEFKKLQQFLL